jgi:hypothetical protein
MCSGTSNSFICGALQRTPLNEIHDKPHGHQGNPRYLPSPNRWWSKRKKGGSFAKPFACHHRSAKGWLHLLFFETPPRPYAEVAKELGLAQGSIGFTRENCLERLRRQISKAGFN